MMIDIRAAKFPFSSSCRWLQRLAETGWPLVEGAQKYILLIIDKPGVAGDVLQTFCNK